MDFRKLLKEKDFIIFDGGMGTMLQGKKIEIPPVPEELNITRPDIVTAIHKAYADAGADIIYANTFGINRRKIKGCKYTVQELTEAAVKNAREAVKGSSALVALDLSPVGELLEPTGTLSFEEAYDIFAEVIDAAEGCDLIVLETMTDLYEVRAAVLAAREHSDLPIVCTMTFEENLRTFTGCSVSAMALSLDALGVDAVGVNCSLGPEELYPVVKEIGRWTDLPVVFKPNAGLPDPMTNLFDLGRSPLLFRLPGRQILG
jgi:5-methyltetrahydrofolate--homocysteine methyltransferase